MSRNGGNFAAGRREAIKNNIQAILKTLETSGVVSLADGENADGGPGVKLRAFKVGKMKT